MDQKRTKRERGGGGPEDIRSERREEKEKEKREIKRGEKEGRREERERERGGGTVTSAERSAICAIWRSNDDFRSKFSAESLTLRQERKGEGPERREMTEE